MAVFPNYYQMAVQFTEEPPIPEPTCLETPLDEDLKDNFVTPAAIRKQ